MSRLTDAGGVFMRSSHSSGSGNCVEVCAPPDGPVVVRDSKDRLGPRLLLDHTQWDGFVAGVKGGEFDPT